MQGSITGGFKLDALTIFASVLPDEAAKSALSEVGWEVAPVRADLRSGGRMGRVDLGREWRRRLSSVRPERGHSALLERDVPRPCAVALGAGHPLDGEEGVLPNSPVRPAWRADAGRRWFSRQQSKRQFPGWPVETALHDFYRAMFTILSELAGESIPMISLWPAGHSWAFLLTHDVETAAGYDNIELLCDIERSAGYRSSWNFVPRNHHVVHDRVIDELWADGFEVGVHGLYHDGRDIDEIDARLPEIHRSRSDGALRGFARLQRFVAGTSCLECGSSTTRRTSTHRRSNHSQAVAARGFPT